MLTDFYSSATEIGQSRQFKVSKCYYNDIIRKYFEKIIIEKKKISITKEMLQHFLTSYNLQTLHNMGINKKINRLGIKIDNEKKSLFKKKEKIIKRLIKKKLYPHWFNPLIRTVTAVL